MKAATLLVLRLCTGLYLLAWGAVKFASPERAIEISDKIYGGQFSNPVGQLALGAAAGVIGIFVILGFLRAFSYAAQALILGFSAAAVGKSVFEPLIGHFDAVALIDAGTVFVPSLAFFVVSLLPFVFWKEDFVALDLDQIGDLEKRNAAKAAPVMAAVAAAPVAEAMAEDALTEEAPAHEEPVAEEASAVEEVPEVEEPAEPAGEAMPEAEAEAVHEAPVEDVVEAAPEPEEAFAEEAAVEASPPEDMPAEDIVAEEVAVEAAPVEAEPVAEMQAEEVAAEEAPAEGMHAAETEGHDEGMPDVIHPAIDMHASEPADEMPAPDEDHALEAELVAQAAQAAEPHEAHTVH